MDNPIISIVLPTYNGAKFLRQSVDSCLAQSFSAFELIIVNDCSTDNTLEIAKEYTSKDARVKIISNEENKRLPLSLNTGFAVARGRYFTWTSDDNYYAPDAMENMLRVLEQDETVDLVYADYHLIDENDKITGSRSFGDINSSFTKWLGCGACFLYKREVHFANKGYNPAAFLIEDYDFFVRAFTRFRFYYLPVKNLYYYREHDASLTANNRSTINDISKIFLERNLPLLAAKLPQHDLALLYRKFAVYHSVTKANINKYMHFLSLLREVSLSQALIVVCYVPAARLWQTAHMCLAGILGIFKRV